MIFVQALEGTYKTRGHVKMKPDLLEHLDRSINFTLKKSIMELLKFLNENNYIGNYLERKKRVLIKINLIYFELRNISQATN